MSISVGTRLRLRPLKILSLIYHFLSDVDVTEKQIADGKNDTKTVALPLKLVDMSSGQPLPT